MSRWSPVLRSGWFITGEECLVRELAVCLGVRRAVGISSCTAAMKTPVAYLDRPPRSRVGVPTSSWSHLRWHRPPTGWCRSFLTLNQVECLRCVLRRVVEGSGDHLMVVILRNGVIGWPEAWPQPASARASTVSRCINYLVRQECRGRAELDARRRRAGPRVLSASPLIRSLSYPRSTG